MSDTEALISEEDDNDSSGLTPSEIRIVLVGKTGSGKSSAGNTILGLELFDTAVSPESITKNCESGQVQIDDRIISVTDTPGLFDTQMEKEQMKDEIIRCIEMSAPGPHAFLLVIRLDVRFTDEEKNTVKWIQENFGVEAARYTIVLFTHFDALEGKPIEEYISENHYLQSLVNECGHRFHSFNNKDKKNRSQVPELLEKIKNLVEENGGEHYTNEIYKEAQRTSNIHQFWLEKPRIVLLGKTGSGKTKTRKNIVGRQGKSPDSATKTCEKQEASVAGKSMRIIDTPGLIGASEEKTKDEIETLVYMSDPGPCVFLLVIKVRRFTEKNTVKWIQENFGEEALRYTIILFTHADHLKEKPLDQYIRETPGLQELTEGFGGRFYSFNNESIEDRDQVTELLEKIEEMMENNKWRHYTSQMLQKAQRRKLFWSGKPRVVLLGKTRSGKSTTGNTIVGRESFKRRNSADFVTKSCKTHKACVDGKGMKVIDTPGLTDASEKTKAEIVKFIKKSAPGLHVFLLVIRLDVRLTEEEKNIVRWIQENFGVEAARYTIVLFTHADTLEGKPLEGYIRESNDVQALVNDCCGRFHSFNNKDMENCSQVPELLEKIEDMMEKNEGGHDTDDIYQDTQGMILDRSQFWLPNPRIVLLGKTGSGKTSAVETIVGRESFTKTCEVKKACVAGKNMRIIDTPGLTDASEEKIKNEIKKLVMKSDPGPCVFLLVIRLDEIFTDKEKNRVKWIEDNFGEDAAHHTIILFTHTDHLGRESIDEYISERRFLQSLIDSCGGRFSIQDRNNPNQVTKLLKIVEKMAEGNELEGYTNEKSQVIVPRTIRRLRDIAIGTGSTGTAAIIAGSIALGVTEVVFAPAAVVTIGAVAVVGAFVFGGIAIYKRFALKD